MAALHSAKLVLFLFSKIKAELRLADSWEIWAAVLWLTLNPKKKLKVSEESLKYVWK